MNGAKLGYGYIGHVLLWLFVLRNVLVPVTPPWFMQSPLEKSVWLALLILPSLAIAYFSLGMFSQLSMVFTVLLLISHGHFVQAALPSPIPIWLLLAAVISAGCLYASALGFLSLDIYAWGFYPRALALVVLVVALLLWPIAPTVSWSLALALVVFAFSLGLSRNLWDCLLDPILFFTALFMLLKNFWRN
jgi:hypothetical protein